MEQFLKGVEDRAMERAREQDRLNRSVLTAQGDIDMEAIEREFRRVEVSAQARLDAMGGGSAVRQATVEQAPVATADGEADDEESVYEELEESESESEDEMNAEDTKAYLDKCVRVLRDIKAKIDGQPRTVRWVREIATQISEVLAVPSPEVEVVDPMHPCTICLDDMSVVRLEGCEHEFHYQCIYKWKRTNSTVSPDGMRCYTCPTCRHLINDQT